ncbi:hypothetical protein IWW51_000121 [Coemansia sp. RSA 2702]|nr:hypothetical protein IWW54_000870 [Coemansia sp. RSA 2705]KAJ2322357.1 hypothetical protein IWW52_000130 [Coemansia sp. RSA 2704]KAJ2330130.1 hypothetical protein IWW51_000121 [Coemansia sp. RSA 2702]KAJ2366869.1 hypothetical protein H4S01_002474 [Coemansia sp. RSA 2610]
MMVKLATVVVYSALSGIASGGRQQPFRHDSDAEQAPPLSGTQALEAWMQQQDEFAQHQILRNIAPILDDPSAMRGAVCASPSRAHPNYYYAWTRDSALVMNELVEWLSANPSNGTFVDEIERHLDDYIAFTRHVQSLPKLAYGLGEAKFHMDGSRFRGSWCNPQTDGPAIRARTVMRYLAHTNDAQRTRRVFDQVVAADLDYVVDMWRHTGGCDIWEEARGRHFYTLLAQHRALLEGAEMAHNLGETLRAQRYARTAQQIHAHFDEFWDSERGYIVATRNATGGIKSKRSNLDAQVLLAVLHHGDARLLSSSKVVATVAELVRVFGALYEVNRVQRTRIHGWWVPLGAAAGRYPEDVYNGDGTSRGNPWSLVTSALAEYHYRLARELAAVGDTGGLAEYLLGVGDRYMARVCRHTDGDHTMYEQWSRRTGFGRGAVHLTWSYAAHMSATRARRVLAREMALSAELI